MENNLQTKISSGNENVTKNVVENFTESLEKQFSCLSDSVFISGIHLA